jgi:hypothetical protein
VEHRGAVFPHLGTLDFTTHGLPQLRWFNLIPCGLIDRMIERERTMRTANASILGVLTAAAACSALSVAWGMSWSDQAAKLVVPFGPGGNADLVARIAAQRLTVTTGHKLNGAIVAEFVARAAPNGETVIGTTPQISILPHLDRRDSRHIP